jgi:hypothetical protein
MVEAPNLLGVHPTSILYVYTVFQHLNMMWMGICVRPYTVLPVQVVRGLDFWKIGVGRSLSDVVMSWLRLQTHLECIPHPFYMYTKCFSTLICCGWAYVCALTLLCLCRLGEDFRKIWAGRSLSDVVMSSVVYRFFTPVGIFGSVLLFMSFFAYLMVFTRFHITLTLNTKYCNLHSILLIHSNINF